MSTDAAAVTTKQIFSALSEGYTGPALAARLWNGDTWQTGSGNAPCTLVLKHPGALRIMFWPFSNISFAESYIFDDFDIEGDIFGLMHWLRHLVTQVDKRGLWDKLQLLRGLMKLPNTPKPRDRGRAGKPTNENHTLEGDKAAIEYTYDLPSELYRLFLDKNMQYTCGYFASPDEDLDAAQFRKIDYVCRKLNLQPGERYVDFGCGWGYLLIHAAKYYGVEATGVTLSGEQARWAQRAINEAGVQDRVKLALCDYHDYRPAVPFDKASSVGMSEHIGNRNLPVFLKKIHECLKPGGAYLHHAIMLRPNTPYPVWTAFARKYVFPNGELQTVTHTLQSAASVGFEIRDVENLREHYVWTLENWVRRLEANREQVLKYTDEVGYRIFRLYMAGATMGFRSGIYGLNQCLVVKPDNGRSGMPLTRAAWYAPDLTDSSTLAEAGAATH